jgi:prepilin-type N-terminal cleavage/methylation domain-containing protein
VVAVRLLKSGPGMSNMRIHDDRGLTLIELMVWMALFTILAGMAVPGLTNVNDGIRLGNSARAIERDLQAARLKAVSANRPMRVKFNCPTAGTFRILEVVGSAVDTAADRCNATKYPYPAADNNPLSVPNHDGPVQRLDLNVSFGAIPTLEFQPDGSVLQVDGVGATSPLPAGGSAITVTKQTKVMVITVNSLGKIQLQR